MDSRGNLNSPMKFWLITEFPGFGKFAGGGGEEINGYDGIIAAFCRFGLRKKQHKPNRNSQGRNAHSMQR